MKKPVILIGIGEMGGVFARGFLRAGYPVYPILRSMDLEKMSREIKEYTMVLVAVAEKDLHPTLDMLPSPWKRDTCLLQNELLPMDWQKRNIHDPTVISVWFEKKRDMETRVILPSPVYGPHAGHIKESLNTLSIPCKILNSEEELTEALVAKNTFVLTINIAGLAVGGTTGELLSEHRELVHRIALEVISLQERLTNQRFSHDSLLSNMESAMNSAPEHKCRGRAAPDRLARTLSLASAQGINTPTLSEIGEQNK